MFKTFMFLGIKRPSDETLEKQNGDVTLTSSPLKRLCSETVSDRLTSEPPKLEKQYHEKDCFSEQENEELTHCKESFSPSSKTSVESDSKDSDASKSPKTFEDFHFSCSQKPTPLHSVASRSNVNALNMQKKDFTHLPLPNFNPFMAAMKVNKDHFPSESPLKNQNIHLSENVCGKNPLIASNFSNFRNNFILSHFLANPSSLPNISPYFSGMLPFHGANSPFFLSKDSILGPSNHFKESCLLSNPFLPKPLFAKPMNNYANIFSKTHSPIEVERRNSSNGNFGPENNPLCFNPYPPPPLPSNLYPSFGYGMGLKNYKAQYTPPQERSSTGCTASPHSSTSTPPKTENEMNFYSNKQPKMFQEDETGSSIVSSAPDDLQNMKNLVSGLKQNTSPKVIDNK